MKYSETLDLSSIPDPDICGHSSMYGLVVDHDLGILRLAQGD